MATFHVTKTQNVVNYKDFLDLTKIIMFKPSSRTIIQLIDNSKSIYHYGNDKLTYSYNITSF